MDGKSATTEVSTINLIQVQELLDKAAQKQAIDNKKMIEDAYKRGREDTAKESEKAFVPAIPDKMVEKGDNLEFIELTDFRNLSKRSARPALHIQGFQASLVFDQDLAMQQSSSKDLTWQEFVQFMPMLQYVYCEKCQRKEVATSFLLHLLMCFQWGFENLYTHASIMNYDRHTRMANSGKATWNLELPVFVRYLIKYDGAPTTSKSSRKPFKPTKESARGEKTPSNRSSTTSKGKGKRGVCFDWLQNEVCKFGSQCDYQHNCRGCKLEKKDAHNMSKCPLNKDYQEEMVKRRRK